jgi:hypothetical protein
MGIYAWRMFSDKTVCTSYEAACIKIRLGDGADYWTWYTGGAWEKVQ